MKKILIALFLGASLSAYAQEEIVLNGKELFGDLKARQIGPALMSGRITDLEAHPTNNRIIYAGTAGGGVWKSNDGGATFNPIFDEHAQSIGVVAVDPNDPDKVIWVGTGETWTRNSTSVGDGLYKSIDGGTNWKKVGFANSERISSIEINPNNSNEIYVGVLGGLYKDSEERGVYKTTDGGATWNKILYSDGKTGCSDLIMDPKDPNILYAAMWEFRRTGWSFSSGGNNSALYKSTDAGKTWNKIHNGFPKGKLGRFAIAVAPSNSNILYTVVESEKNEDKGLYRSDDAGKSWTHLNSDFGLVVRPFYFSRIVVDPRDPEVVVKAGLFGSLSRDGGKTFKSLGQMHPDIHDILFDIKDSDRMYSGTDGGVYRSWNGGTTFEIVSNIPVSQFYHISIDDKEPYNIYGGLQDNGSWYGPSASPGGIEARDWNVLGFGDGFRVLKHPTKDFVYSEMQGAENVWRYDMVKKRTKTVQPLPVKGDPKLRFNWNAPMAISKHQPDRFYMGSQFLHKSEDMGDTWVKISPDLTTNDPKKQDQSNSGGLSVDNSGAENHTTIFTIAESPLDEKIIWVGTDDGNVQVTKDGGKSWTNTVKNISGLPANTWCYHIEASVHNKGTAYAVFEGHTTGDMKTYAYKTTDYGVTWKSIVTDDIYGFSRNIQEDFVQPDLLYLGTEFGLYITIDGGKNWNKFTNNMPAVAVHYIELSEKTNDLILGTHGRGVMIIDDISPLRQISQDVLQQDVHFFDSKPTVISEESNFGGTSTELEFVGPNPNRDAKIIYYLKKRHTFGKMAIDILDENGTKLIELTPGKSKGINVVTWNYLIKQPKMAKGKTLSFGGFTSPRVPAGKYKVVMRKGKDTYDTELELINDPNSLLTDQDRVALHETTIKLYNMSEQLAYLVYKIDESIAKSEQVMSVNANGKKVAEPISKELNTLKEKLVITTGDNYVGSAEPQLREKLSNLYSKIASGFEPPSSSEIENMTLLEEQFKDALTNFEKVQGKMNKMNKFIEEAKIEPIVFKSYEAFIEE
uniref:WD40/YVTN/BNR-like repeat-containing protein n=1 Tax=Fulvivirga sp. TaxID=1931237 RepID=UPI00404AD1C1